MHWMDDKWIKLTFVISDAVCFKLTSTAISTLISTFAFKKYESGLPLNDFVAC